MNNDEFMYYFHGTNITDPNLVKEVFNNGLINYRGNDMASTMWPMKIHEGELGQKMKEYAGTKGNTVFVIKIPKYYLYPKTLNGELQQAPMPIWKHLSSFGEHGDVSQLSPELVYGVYFAENDSFIQNPNYSPVHNPNGLQFDVAQIGHLRIYASEDWIRFANSRNNYSYDQLLQSDDKTHMWDDYVRIYNEHFGVDGEKKHNSQR